MVIQLETLRVFPKIVNMLINNCRIGSLIDRTMKILGAPAVQLSNYTMWKHQVMIGLTSGAVFENDHFRNGILRTLVVEIERVTSTCIAIILNPTAKAKGVDVLKNNNCVGALEVLDNIIRHLEQTAVRDGGSHAVAESVAVLVDLDTGVFRLVCQLCSVLESVYPNHCSIEAAKIRVSERV